jgi:NAD(P)-dependent dehydrogenase (short-subunit alcohol dehydrogenase family)
LDEKVAVVTGGGSGIGAAIAELFAGQGAAVAVLEIDRKGAEEVVARIAGKAGRAISLSCDVTSADEVARAFGEVVARFGALDVLVNNAGIAHIGTALDTSEEDFDRIFTVNVKGVHLCTQAALRIMVPRRKGVILNLASIASLIGLEDRYAYSMSKGAVLTMTRSVAVDFMKDGIRCNCVCPARIHTPFVDGFLKKTYPGREAEMFEKLSRYQPVGRMGEPGEVAALALYLCADESAFVTGQAFPIDGGVLVK